MDDRVHTLDGGVDTAVIGDIAVDDLAFPHPVDLRAHIPGLGGPVVGAHVMMVGSEILDDRPPYPARGAEHGNLHSVGHRDDALDAV